MSDDLDARKPMRLISFKAPEADHTLVARMATGAKSVSAFMRQLIHAAAGQFGPSLPKAPTESPRGKPAPVFTRPAPDPELVQHLAKVGNALNQLAKGVHVCRHNESTVDLPKLFLLLLMIDSHLEYLREQYTTAPVSESDPPSEEASR